MFIVDRVSELFFEKMLLPSLFTIRERYFMLEFVCVFDDWQLLCAGALCVYVMYIYVSVYRGRLIKSVSPSS